MRGARRGEPAPTTSGRVLDGRWRPALLGSLADLVIGQFAFVMATGIISTALWDNGAELLSRVLLTLGVLAYAALCVVHLARLLRWRDRVLAELVGAQGFTFLTLVAASNVLSERLVVAGHATAAEVLFGLGLVGWVVLGYGVPLGMIAHAPRAPSLDPVNGTWFIWVVGTESVAIAAGALAEVHHSHALEVFGGLCWAVGVVQYLLVAAIALARLLLRRVALRDSVAPYWVFMGSAAITILAGSRLLLLRQDEGLFAPSVVQTVSMVLWSFASWLIPLLVALGVTRTLRWRRPVRYRTAWWGAVFPVGMYGVACQDLGTVSHQGWLVWLGRRDAWVGLAVWLVVVAMALLRREHSRAA